MKSIFNFVFNGIFKLNCILKPKPLSVILLLSLFTQSASSIEKPKSLNTDLTHFTQGPSDQILKRIESYNLNLDTELRSTREPRATNFTAFSEWEETGYLVFSDEDRYGSNRIKKELVENLPEDVDLVVYTQNQDPDYQEKLLSYYEYVLAPGRVNVLKLPTGGMTNLWTRDNTPIAVTDSNENAFFVDAKYYYNFEPDQSFGDVFDLELLENPYFFEGGNLVNNSVGDCIVVNRRRRYPFGTSDTAAIPDSIFSDLYGCTNLIRLEHLKGIGHSDEVVKFLDDTNIITDTEEYVELLEAQGFTVTLLPEPETNFGTYINSLIVNDVVYVPSFSEAFFDSKALEIYKKLMPDYRFIQVESSELSSRGQGGLHCITMTYPPFDIKDLTQILNATLE